MRITVSNPDNEYRTFIDTDVSDVLITEAYIGPKFVSNDGEELNVCMRDSGFEIVYIDGDDVEHHYSLNDGLSVGRLFGVERLPMTTWFRLPESKVTHLLISHDIDYDRFPLGKAACGPLERLATDTLLGNKRNPFREFL